MKSMDNKKVIKQMEKYALHKYVNKLLASKLHKVTLFTIFQQTGAPNLSNAVNLVIVDDLEKISSLNGGNTLN